MESANSTASSQVQTFSTAALLLLVGVVDLIWYVRALLATRELSPWITATVVNMIFGGVFAVGYVFMRNGPAVFCIPSRVFAFLWPLLANFAVLWYMSYVIIAEKNVVLGVLPYSDGRLDSVVPMRTDGEQKKSQLIRVFAWLAVVVMAFACVRAAWKESLVAGWKSATAGAWGSFVYINCSAGVVFVAVYIVAREGACVGSALWVAALLLLGNMATFAYVAAVASRALATETPFPHVMLSMSRTPRARAT